MRDGSPTGTPSPSSLSLDRELAAPIDAVWRAWTTKALLERWWAPPGFVFTVQRLDLRVGGAIDFEFVEVGAARHPAWREELEASGIPTAFTAHGRFSVVAPPTRLAFVQALRFGARTRPLEYALSVRLTEVPRGTRAAVVVESTPTKHWAVLGRGNLEGQLDRLEGLLQPSERTDG